MLLDIIFLLFVCIILIIKLIKSFNYKIFHFHHDKNETKHVKPNEIIVEDIIIDQQISNDEELKHVDQKALTENLKIITHDVWEAFYTGETFNIVDKVNQSVLINMEKKIKLYPNRSALENITSFKMKKLHKNEKKFFADVYIISEIREISRTYKNIEEWSFSCEKNTNNWIVEHTSAF